MNLSLFLSFLLHFLLILLFIQPHFFQKRVESRTIPIFLQARNLFNHSQTQRVSKLPSQKPQANHVYRNKNRSAKESVNQKNSGNGNRNEKDTLDKSPTGASGVNKVASEYATELISALNQLKEYPSSSKERRETGQVQLSFKLRKNGEITEIKILQSSPYQQLNEAALNTVQKLGKFKPVPDEISKGDWNVILPIEFKVG